MRLVEDNCNKLARKLQDENFYLALKLIQLGREHDVSKFDFYEFNNLNSEADPAAFKVALSVHHIKNKHHPEHWIHGVKSMPDEYLAEMVCDCVARGQEFGTDTRKFFTEDATKKYNFTLEDECGKKIMKYLDLLLTKPFEKL